MNPSSRLFMDVSYTRTQHVSVGITRTVRRLEDELRRLCRNGKQEFVAVSFHSAGFRKLADGVLPPPVSAASSTPDDRGARLFRWIAGSFFRRMVLIALMLPWPLLRLLWSLTSAWSFNFLSRNEQSITFRPGDMLLLSDACWNYPVWVAARRAQAQGAKVAFVVYDLMPFQHPEFCFPLVPLIFRLWLDRMLPLADCVICISQSTESDLTLHARATATPLPPTGHFRLGSDPVRGDDPTTHVRLPLRDFLSAGTPCFAAIGSFEPKKNYAFLLEVFDQLWKRGCDLRLLVIGRESAECADLVQRVRAHSQQGKQLLTLFDATDAEVAFTYANCRALIFPSLAEGFGLPLVEARTRGALVIASDIPAFIELSDPGVTIYRQGSHTALGDAVIEHAQRESRADIRPMPAFSWEDSARQCVGLCEQLFDAKKICVASAPLGPEL